MLLISMFCLGGLAAHALWLYMLVHLSRLISILNLHRGGVFFTVTMSKSYFQSKQNWGKIYNTGSLGWKVPCGVSSYLSWISSTERGVGAFETPGVVNMSQRS